MLEQRLDPGIEKQAFLLGLLQLPKLCGQLPLLPLIVRPITQKVLPADQPVPVVLIGRLFQPAEPL